jgi:hypothetical protein
MRYGKNDDGVYFKVFNRTKRATRLVCQTDFLDDWNLAIDGVQHCTVSIRNVGMVKPFCAIKKRELEHCITKQIAFLKSLTMNGKHFETDTYQILMLLGTCYNFYSNEKGAGVTFHKSISIPFDWRKSDFETVSKARQKVIGKIQTFSNSLQEML